jgi:peptidoglycan-associated lipoprotein
MMTKRSPLLLLAAIAALALGACGDKDKPSPHDSGTAPPPTIETTVGTDPLADIYGTDMGAPVGPQAGTQADLVATAGDRVFFATDRHDLSPEARAVLEAQAAWLRRYPHLSVVVEGHADERGTREYNLALGERRAQAARNYLVTLGVDSSRLQTISYGKERPVAPGSDPESWALNRRAVTVVD